MNALKTLELIDKYQKCLQCDNEAIGNGEGTLEVTDNTFIRTCKCGWKIKLKEDK